MHNLRPHCRDETKQEKSNVKYAIEVAEEIEDLAANAPDEANDFAISISEKAADIAANIEKHGRATAAQVVALENMLDGIQRWFSD